MNVLSIITYGSNHRAIATPFYLFYATLYRKLVPALMALGPYTIPLL